MSDAVYAVGMTDGAENDLKSIRDYLAEKRSPDDADRLLVSLLDRIDTLEHFPLRGAAPLEAADVGNRELRQILHLPYRLIYQVDGNSVTIIAIVDGRRDVQSFLRQRLLEN